MIDGHYASLTLHFFVIVKVRRDKLDGTKLRYKTKPVRDKSLKGKTSTSISTVSRQRPPGFRDLFIPTFIVNFDRRPQH